MGQLKSRDDCCPAGISLFHSQAFGMQPTSTGSSDGRKKEEKNKTPPAGSITSDEAARAGLNGAKVLSCEAVEGSGKRRRFSPDFWNGELCQECVHRNRGVLEA